MINTFLESDSILLEPLEKKHLTDEYINWLNDKESTQYNTHGIFPNTYEKTRQYIESSQNNTQITLAIIDKKSLDHIGNISIYKIDFINSNADISILIGNRNYWGKGYGSDAFSLVIQHCFNKLNLHKVTAGTTSDNIGMQKILTKLNMSKEGILREAIQRNQLYFDIYLYGLIKRDFIEK